MANLPKLGTRDPIDRFVDLASRLGWTRPSDAVAPVVLEKMIQGDDAAPIKQAVAHHIALNTVLTHDAATKAVEAAFAAVGGDQKALKDPGKTAKAVSDATSAAAASFSGDLELSDPVMLAPTTRILAALVMAGGLILSIVVVSRLDPKSTNWAYGALAVLGVGCLLGVIIVVMG